MLGTLLFVVRSKKRTCTNVQ